MFGEGVGAIFQGRLDRGVIVQGALGARHFLVQRFALEIADHPAIEVELVQVAAALFHPKRLFQNPLSVTPAQPSRT